MFDSLKERFENIFAGLRGKGKLTPEDINEALREVRRALLEADVNYKVVKDVVEAIKVRATGRTVLDSVTPAQLIFTIVYEELVRIMGEAPAPLTISPKPPTIYMMVGLQGSGKTTTAVKIARKMAKSHKPLVVACDLRRPAAVDQLRVLAEKSNIPFWGPEPGETDPVKVASKSRKYAEDHLCDMIILDTAGRLQMDDELMTELETMKAAVPPTEILLVVDSMTGQEAVNVAETFHKRLGLTGVVLTKLDGDARGGPALAVRASTGVPIKLAGCGEKTEDLEVFDAKRIAQRIIGMGDIEGLLEKVQSATSEADINRMTENLKKNRFTLEDMLLQLQQIQKMGPLEKVLEMLPVPGGSKALKDANIDPKRMKQTEAIILSMTLKERRNPEIIKGSRRRRIAEGSGTTVQMVNQVLAQYEQMKTMMKGLGRMASGGKGFKMPPGMGMGGFGGGRRGFFK
ncbi:MAG TPA: signal recognition particle protein [Synergistaceae bacterium]|jgi:signal recognition particle subunit SRP54|nr:signal recognition particle protein [Synergistaceae bacterium]HPX03561.1 signal recognition particle protein [Synergistaceae bacterium]HQA54550.1 signal recognition particle protein [Synergistaceae bacterium]